MDICKIKNSNFEKTMKAIDKILKTYPYSKVGFNINSYRYSMDNYKTVVIRLEDHEIHCSWSSHYYEASRAPSYEDFVMVSKLDIE